MLERSRSTVLRRAPALLPLFVAVFVIDATVASPGERARASPLLSIVVPDTAPEIGRKVAISARLEDPGLRVMEVRFMFNGEPSDPILRDLTDARPTFSQPVTPRDSRRISVLVEGVDSDGQIVARDLLWLSPMAPFKEEIRVRAALDWSDLIPTDSNLHQHPVVLVHPLHPERLSDEERRFGLNTRAARVLFMVDTQGFAGSLDAILGTLMASADPAAGLVRATDDVAILLLSREIKLAKDFADGGLAKMLATLPEPEGTPSGGAGPRDLAAVLATILASMPEDRVGVCIVVTNGVRWGELWKSKTIPGVSGASALLTPDDLSQIHSLSFVKEIPIIPLAVSTPAYPLKADAKSHLDLSVLRQKLFGGAASAAGEPEAERFETTVRQRFDLLRRIAETTGAGRKIWLAGDEGAGLKASIRDILFTAIGKFQRRDFRVVEAGSKEGCASQQEEQTLDGARYRGRDKTILALALDESGSTQTDKAASQILEASERIIGSLRPEDDCVLFYTFSAGLPATSFECLKDPERIRERIQDRVRFRGATDIYGAALDVANDMADAEKSLQKAVGVLEEGQEVRKVIVLVTDGYQTVDDTTAAEATKTLVDHSILLFQILIEGMPIGKFTRGWPSAVGGMDLPPAGEMHAQVEIEQSISRMIESVYWGMRESYRIDYTSTGKEKDRRQVCVGVRDRPDLFVSKERGDTYVADKSAVSHLLDLARDGSADLPKRRRAIDLLSEIGTEFESASLRKLASGPEEALRLPSAMALLRLAHRLNLPAERVQKSLEDLDGSTRCALVRSLPLPGAEKEGQIAETLLLHELQRRDGQRAEARPEIPDIRMEALLALGRIDRPLGPETMKTLAALSEDGDPSIKLAASKLLEDIARHARSAG